MPRFVVLYHETKDGYPRSSHYDLMLECDEGLRTWALGELPAPGRTSVADRLPDHRLAYLDYEGQVAGDRGCVHRIDAGEYDLVEETQTGLVVMLRGARLEGKLTLTSLLDDPAHWHISHSVDD